MAKITLFPPAELSEPTIASVLEAVLAYWLDRCGLSANTVAA